MISRVGEQRIEVRPRMRGGEGETTVQHLFAPADFGAPVRLCSRLILPPGASIGTHVHEGEDEIYVITRGRAKLTDNGAQTELGPGDAVLTGKGAAHAIANAGDEPLELLAVIVLYDGQKRG
ncbi:MAG: cupin domain-containing protein [Kiritimatiellae bacterium]|nr:cupin domain-containing protein [Kiritimatiellia bacterium]